MATVLHEPQNACEPNRSAAEWGLASLLLGGLLAVIAVLTLQINLQMYFSPRAWPAGDLRPIHDVAIVGAIVIAGMTIAGIAFGIRSLVIAYRCSQPCALGWAGLLMSVFALLLWIGVFVDLFSVVDMLMRGAAPGLLDTLKQAMPAAGMH